MMDEALLRPAIFVGILAAMLIAEAMMPHHADPMRRARSLGNGLLFLAGIMVARLILPLGALGIAAFVEAGGWGLLPVIMGKGPLLIGASLLLLDLAIWLQHLVFHKVGWLWRLHRVHHSDPYLDVTSGLRFHPLEIVLSLSIKALVIALLGAPVLAVFLFEVLLNAGSMITHANIRLPERLDRIIRLVLVTPGMHRVHHSVERAETDSNYGFTLAIWDRIFGTYCAEPRRGEDHVEMGIGLFQARDQQGFIELLTQPFRKK